MIAILDYGAGNLTSVLKALRHLGADAQITADPHVAAYAQALVLPGVGHFSSTCEIENRQLLSVIREALIANKPFLGICVGLQWMFEGSEEAPSSAGLGLYAGQCRRFDSSVRVPHVGWNQLCDIQSSSRILAGIPDGSYVYYTHSYFAPVVNQTVAVTDYGTRFTGAAEYGYAFAVQFHPEKSGDTGLAILNNFARLAC